jgi:hypothetical protein
MIYPRLSTGAIDLDRARIDLANRSPETYRRLAMSSTATYMKWTNRVRDTSNAWTENDIIYFRKYVRGLGSTPERATLMQLFERTLELNDGYLITNEQSEKGREYLLSNTLKKNGDRRKHAKLGERELDILRDLREHRLVGRYEPTYGNYSYWLPVYRAISNTGEHFEYVGTMYSELQIVG